MGDVPRVKETFAVRDAEPVTRELTFTRHGPVIWQDKKRAFAVQAAWLEPGMAPYFGSVEYMRANNWNEFLGALNRWGAPSENQVYADIDGNIGYKPAGLTPIRKNYDGLLPVPGDGRFEWQGFYDMDVLPVEYNPERGWSATANAMSLPGDYPYKDIKPGFEWADPWRIDRIAESLRGDTAHTLEDSLSLQRDYLSLPARFVLGATNTRGLPEPARSLFADWDFRLSRDSGAAALFEIWFSRYLAPAVMRQKLPDVDPEDLGRIRSERAVSYYVDLPAEQREQLASATINAAIEEVRGHLGADASQWRWGDLHTITFRHPLAALVDAKTAATLSLPEVGRGGSGATPNNTRYDDKYQVRGGASWRMVLDVGNWDNAYMTNVPGQSGVPGNSHFGDLLQNWADDGYLPLLYSREAIEQRTRQVIKLLPAQP